MLLNKMSRIGKSTQKEVAEQLLGTEGLEGKMGADW